jgi:chromosome segregation ATPase
MGSSFQTLTDANAALKQQHVRLSVVSEESAQLREKVIRLSSRAQDLERCLMAQKASPSNGDDSGQQHFWRVPKECSAQMADLQAQVWKLRARERSTAANCEQLQSALDVAHETLRRAQQRDEACSRIVAKAVAALTIDYPGVFQACAELARAKCPRGVLGTQIQGGYYTLAAYACQIRPPPKELSA